MEGEIVSKSIYENNYDKMVKLGIITAEGQPTFKEYKKMRSKNFMDLNMDVLSISNTETIISKSQSAKCLSKFYPKGVRLEIDILRSMVISVDWMNQNEHINMLNISAKLVYDFIKLGFGPVIVVDTFSNGKIVEYLDNLNQLDKDLSIRVFGLYTSEEELQKRIQFRKKGEFRKYDICQRLNEEVMKKKYPGEYQIDTTGLLAKETAKIIFDYLINTS